MVTKKIIQAIEQKEYMDDIENQCALCAIKENDVNSPDLNLDLISSITFRNVFFPAIQKKEDGFLVRQLYSFFPCIKWVYVHTTKDLNNLYEKYKNRKVNHYEGKHINTSDDYPEHSEYIDRLYRNIMQCGYRNAYENMGCTHHNIYMETRKYKMIRKSDNIIDFTLFDLQEFTVRQGVLTKKN